MTQAQELAALRKRVEVLEAALRDMLGQDGSRHPALLEKEILLLRSKLAGYAEVVSRLGLLVDRIQNLSGVLPQDGPN